LSALHFSFRAAFAEKTGVLAPCSLANERFGGARDPPSPIGDVAAAHISATSVMMESA
jgi:hypothetical protein